MNNFRRVAAASLAFFAVGACAQLQTLAGRQGTATVTLNAASGDLRGGGEVWQDNNGQVHVDLRLKSLSPGTHAIHFHSVGKCDAAPTPTFSSAGGHYNPMARAHGLANPDGPHAGDAPNITADSNGNAHVQFVTQRVSITPGAAQLFDADGSSLVVHAGPDDQVSQPAGNSGERIACGVVRQVL